MMGWITMNYIKNEQKLLEAQIKVTNQLKQLELLSKLDTLTAEFEAKIPEHIPVTVKTEEQLGAGDKLVLPLKIVGRMLGIGRHKHRYYTEEELKKAVVTHKGKLIPLKLDHEKDKTSSTIGAVDEIRWDEDEKAIMYEAHVNDATHARNVLDTVIGDVSAGILSVPSLDLRLGIVGKDLEFTELSFVEEGAYKGNTVEVRV